MTINYPAQAMSACACCEPALSIGSGNGPTRRNFLAGGVAALGLTGTPALAQTPAKPLPRIDIHHHYVPPAHDEATAIHRVGGRPPKWSPEQSIEEMDRNGIQTSICSLVQPGVWFGNVEDGRKLSRACNEYGAQMVQKYPGRFGFFAALPLPDVEGSLKEIEYSFDVLKADGIGLFTSYGLKYLGDPAFEPVFKELNRRKAVIYIHPTTSDCCKGLVPSVPSPTIEFATDTTRAIGGIVFSGIAASCPDIQFIWSHSGGTLPFLTTRFERLGDERKNVKTPGGVRALLQKMHYEIAQGTSKAQLLALLQMVSVSQVMFGTDYPLRPCGEAVEGLNNYPFTVDELRAINHDNALKLLPRLQRA